MSGMVQIRPPETRALRQHGGSPGHVANEYAQQPDLPRGRLGTPSQGARGFRSDTLVLVTVDGEPAQ